MRLLSTTIVLFSFCGYAHAGWFHLGQKPTEETKARAALRMQAATDGRTIQRTGLHGVLATTQTAGSTSPRAAAAASKQQPPQAVNAHPEQFGRYNAANAYSPNRTAFQAAFVPPPPRMPPY